MLSAACVMCVFQLSAWDVVQWFHTGCQALYVQSFMPVEKYCFDLSMIRKQKAPSTRSISVDAIQMQACLFKVIE